MKPKLGDYVVVLWTDAVASYDEVPAEMAPKMPTVRTTGILLAETEESWSVGWEETNHPGELVPKYRGMTTIPKAWKARIIRLGG